jgi:DNA-binding NarL/FixJ family response regulator
MERIADMIQPISSTYKSEYNSNAVPSVQNPDELAFRSWQTRRDAARQQIRRLSRRELQVVQLVSSGLANKSIALELEISVKTIEKHRANASRKLGVGSAAEMVRLTVLADHEVTPARLTLADNLDSLANAGGN